jgi:hypothetical protein
LHAAFDAGADGEFIHLLLFKQPSRAQLFNLDLLCFELRIDRLLHDVELLFLHLKTADSLFPLRDGELRVQLRVEVRFQKFLLDLLRDLRLLQIALCRRDKGLLIEGLTLEPHLKIRVVGFSLLGLPFEIIGVGFHLGVRENQQNGVRIHFVARLAQDLAYLAVELGLNPQDVFGDKRALPVNVAHHFASLDGINQDVGSLHSGRGRFQLIYAPAPDGNRGGGKREVNNPPDRFVSCHAFSLDVHGVCT